MASPKINQLQLLQQNLQTILMQKQQFQNQIVEYDSALSELKSTEKAYKIVGNIMISTSKEELLHDLQQKKEVAEIRIKNFQQQEDKLKQNLEEIQKEVLAELNKNSTPKQAKHQKE